MTEFAKRTQQRNWEIMRLKGVMATRLRYASAKGRTMLKTLIRFEIEKIKTEHAIDKANTLTQRRKLREAFDGRVETRVVRV